MPTAVEREGDFSQSFDSGKRIPATGFNPAGQKALSLFPLLNFVHPALSGRNQWNYISKLSGDFVRHSEVARIDVALKKTCRPISV